MLGLLAGVFLATSGAATAKDCSGGTCGSYDTRLTVNGQPFYGAWTIIKDRPYVGIEAFSDYLGVPRSHYYKGWSLAHNPSAQIAPLDLKVMTEDKPVDTIRFAGVTMIDLYKAAEALNLPVHHNFQRRIIQVGNGYTGEDMPGRWYRYLSRTKGWMDADWLETLTKSQPYQWEQDHGGQRLRDL